MASIIKVEHLSYVYNPGMPNAVTALDDVSFEVEEGDFVGIIGATGSGKSTLITHMNGLNKPTSGKIIIDGRDLWAEPEKIRDFRFLTGLVFQYPEYQLFEETCYKDIAFGPKNMGLDEAEIDARVHEAARFDDLDEAPTLHLGHRTGLHNADGVAHASRALLVVSVQLLGAGHHLAVLGVTLALGDGDNNGLGTGDGGNDTRTDLTRVTRISHVLSLGPTRRQRTSPLRSRGRAAP